MKQLFAVLVMLLSASMLFAQDVITLRNGETINGKVAEVGTTEIRYYKADNAEGPVYVANKSDVVQIVYANGAKDVFTTQSSANQNVANQNYYRRYRRGYNRPFLYPIITPHIDLGRHINVGHHSYGGHHGGGHHGGHH
ncbi:MAG: hypothetical protein J0M30_00025 [Chitinophagales bacterium]|jgi:hypothetical protein|nr:hypothetical protein [Chitinophagales bacterium]